MTNASKSAADDCAQYKTTDYSEKSDVELIESDPRFAEAVWLWVVAGVEL